MTKKMLVDASHPEETRVVVLTGNRVEEFDYESADKLQLKGNIYLAKVTRVEPSLQACFVEYGGNRHGFLPFSEIHPDYYRIPKEDRVALMEAERAAERSIDDSDDEDDAPATAQQDDDLGVTAGHAASDIAETQGDGYPSDFIASHDAASDAAAQEGETSEIAALEDAHHEALSNLDAAAQQPDDYQPRRVQSYSASEGQNGDTENGAEQTAQVETVEATIAAEDIETIGAEDALEEVPNRKPRMMRRYKIQEVIARKQILLIQVVKEERGSKGAALTTYLSLAGRYCVLMPNTDRGGGVSRKIANPADRRKLKELARDLEVPDGMGVIIRTAGANRTKQEIKRDFEYLLREWDAVRELTLKSTAPTLVYEEGSLIKRAIRDLFNKDVDQLLVQGKAGFDEARDFMRLIMPSHTNLVEPYEQNVPLYQAYGVEPQLDSMFQPTVRLRSGGYIVINQTEALVAIDVNSGKATREHNIEDTALKTNLEAAEEIARQLRLRDLAGLVVIDFIDMEESRNNRHVEKRLKDSLKLDRARIQVGRISPFGLLEMSRQRLRSGVVEGSTVTCPHCEGRGFIRSVGSMALRVMRAVEEYCQRQKGNAVTLRLPPEIAIYILNHKRSQMTELEERSGVYIYVEAKPSLTASAYEIEQGAPAMAERRVRKPATAVSLGSVIEEFPIADEPEDVSEAIEDEAETTERPDAAELGGAAIAEERGNRRRRRRGRGARGGDDRFNRTTDQGQQPRVAAEPRVPAEHAQRPERPFGIPSPAEFHFGPLDLPDTSPEAFETRQHAPQPIGDDSDYDGDTEDDGSDDANGNQLEADGNQQQERRGRRRGRRGRRGRGGRDGRDPRPERGDRDTRPQQSMERSAHESGLMQEPFQPAATSFTHPALKSSAPQFSLTADAEPLRERENDMAPRSAPEPRVEPRTEPKSDWNLATFFGFGPKDAPREREPVKVSAEEPPAPEDQASDQPKKRGWWQRSQG